MSKKSKIKWRKEDSKKVTNLVRKFNAKLTRILNSDPEMEMYLPDRISTDFIKSKIETRQDFNRVINEYERFMIKGAEDPITTESGIKTTKWEKQEVGYKVAAINRKRSVERKKANVTTYKGTMGSLEANNLKPKKYNIDTIRYRDWNKFKESVEKQIMSNYQADKIKKYKQNYLKAIQNNLGFSAEAQEFYRFIEGLDEEFMYKSYYDDPLLQIQFISDPLPIMEIIESATEHWKEELGKLKQTENKNNKNKK